MHMSWKIYDCVISLQITKRIWIKIPKEHSSACGVRKRRMNGNHAFTQGRQQFDKWINIYLQKKINANQLKVRVTKTAEGVMRQSHLEEASFVLEPTRVGDIIPNMTPGSAEHQLETFSPPRNHLLLSYHHLLRVCMHVAAGPAHIPALAFRPINTHLINITTTKVQTGKSLTFTLAGGSGGMKPGQIELCVWLFFSSNTF